MAYIQTNTTGESLVRVYGTIRTLTKPRLGTRTISVVEVYPHIQWAQVWRNLHIAWITEEERSVWYGVIQVLVPTNDRLDRIAQKENDYCSICGERETIKHRILVCREG
jgi:hypothetical protein